MTLQPFVGRRFEDVHHLYHEKDAILYALGLGLGLDPSDSACHSFVQERYLQALPTMAVVLGYPGFWLRDIDSGIDWKSVLHVSQEIDVWHPLPASGHVIGRQWIDGFYDRGPGRGAYLDTCRSVVDAASGDLLASIRSRELCRMEGGFGGPPAPRRLRNRVPESRPDVVRTLPTSAQSALIYRLSGDDNPLHVDPVVARQAGFVQPILHGLCTFGVVGYALLGALCGYRAERFAHMEADFTAPVLPGDSITTQIWCVEKGLACFRAVVASRNEIVVDNGLFRFRQV